MGGAVIKRCVFWYFIFLSIRLWKRNTFIFFHKIGIIIQINGVVKVRCVLLCALLDTNVRHFLQFRLKQLLTLLFQRFHTPSSVFRFSFSITSLTHSSTPV